MYGQAIHKLSRIRKLKHVCTAFLLISVLTLLSVRVSVSPTTPTIALYPSVVSGYVTPNLYDRAFVEARVADVVDCANFQVFITWTPSVLQMVRGVEGSFLKGNPNDVWEASPQGDESSLTASVVGENLGTGDGSNKVFYLDHKPVVRGSDTVFINGAPQSKDPPTYNVDYFLGAIGFFVAPGSGDVVTANYSYYLAENPSNSRDMGTNPEWADTYTSFKYSAADGHFTVGNFSREPWGWDIPSQILSLELKIKYSAAASTSGDKYRIVYYVGTISSPGTKTVLVDWTSDAAVEQTLVFANPVEPTDGIWDWIDLWDMAAGMATRGLHVAVETDKVLGDPNAVFNLYEAWATVTYTRPTFKVSTIDNVSGYASLGVTPMGAYPGIDGSGTLCIFEFVVVGAGSTALNIGYPPTYLSDSDNVDIPCNKLSGVFREPIVQDVNGDAAVNILDLAIVGINYMKTTGYINPPQADVDKSGTVDIMDLARVAVYYGYQYPPP